MHYIEKIIISRLIKTNSLTYSALKPKNLESNHFVYYLNKLIKEKVIEKKNNKYTLAIQGLHLADRLSFKEFNPRIQPKIVTLIACKNKKGEYLLYRRKLQPFLTKIGFPYGKIHLKETIKEAAQRELHEKTSLTATLTYGGDAYIQIYEKENLISHILFHVFKAKNPKGTLKANSSIGYCFWKKIGKKDIDDKTLIPGFKEIFTLLKKKRTFFAEFVISSTEL